jgi:phosphatidate cytidylyltransferase
MNPTTQERLFGTSHAFDSGVVRFLIFGLAGLLIICPIVMALLSLTKKTSDKTNKELWDRYKSWLIFIPMMFGPVLLGGAYVIAGVFLLALFCYREFARATGLFREPWISLVVDLGIAALTFAAADHWYAFFVALPPITISLMAAAALVSDRPKGYIQRVALGIFAYMLFGVCCGHIAYFANDSDYRPMLLWMISAVGLNDIFAYVVGKTLGRRKLAPNTSPNKTIAGAVGAVLLTTTYAALLGHYVFAGSALDRPGHLIVLGLILSAAGQLGDLTLSSIKRDLGIKDWADTFPGHGGLLDRFNSLLFAAPAAFYYIGYIRGIGLNQPMQIFTVGN